MINPQNSNSESARSSGFDDAPSDHSSFSSSRYRIERTLGSGGMAYVLLATDLVLDRKVAIKVPHRKPHGQRDVTEQRFLREAQAAAGLSHPNICPIYDIGESDGFSFITMGYVEGCLLSQAIRETDRFEEDEVAQVIRKIASGAAEAHRQGILHRDLKPGNIMFDRRGEPIILDFGLARFFSDPEKVETLTHDGQTLGTPAYMSPEQATGERDLTPASDIFSLGVIMWEMLCGERPFQGDTLMVMGQIVHGMIPSPRLKRPDISKAMEAICLKAMSKDPENRFQSMDQFQTALEDVLAGRKVSIDLTRFNSLRRNNDTLDLRKTPAPESQLIESHDTQVEPSGVRRALQHPLFWVWIALAVIFGLLVFIAVGHHLRPPRPEGLRPEGPPAEFGPGSEEFPLIPPPRPEMTADDVFAEYDRNGDQFLDRSEFPPHIIERADADGDHQLDLKELVAGLLFVGPDLYLPPEDEQGPPGQGGPPGDRRPPPDGRRPPPGGPGGPAGRGGPGGRGLRPDRPPPEGPEGFGPGPERPPRGL